MPLGMPTYMASGGHYFGQTRYRFLILPRYDCDLHSIIRSRQVETKNILVIANQLIEILEHIHDCGYAHSDIKAENIMIGKCTYEKDNSSVPSQISSASSIQADANRVAKRKPVRKLQMTLTRGDSTNRQAKRNAKSKSYGESNSSDSEDSDFGEDFEKLSDDDDEYDEDEDEDVHDEDELSNSGECRTVTMFHHHNMCCVSDRF